MLISLRSASSSRHKFLFRSTALLLGSLGDKRTSHENAHKRQKKKDRDEGGGWIHRHTYSYTRGSLPFFPTDEIEAVGRSRPVASRSSLEMWVMLSVAYIVSLSRYL